MAEAKKKEEVLPPLQPGYDRVLFVPANVTHKKPYADYKKGSALLKVYEGKKGKINSQVKSIQRGPKGSE